ncbi:hypothetical protein NVIE_1304 [Nitrososphaera viennensis EN76]|uniref:Uncharacterized protein n=1 Tax=Nitrososphaera viennensis EN76 TaxID=926571 RepID=A0A060HQS6_9ARCH|nr:hypothetical protein NVIE_1304 [Nitrososphaera viennensis EN76]
MVDLAGLEMGPFANGGTGGLPPLLLECAQVRGERRDSSGNMDFRVVLLNSE